MKTKKTEFPVDIVLPWVDGSDPEWIQERLKYQPSENLRGANEARYRDWGLLRYLFRGIEENLPWIRNVFFVTWKHLPSWLDTSCPKLKIVEHKDYIPEKYLPTFSANPIELNIHRIPGLSECFIYFNDDTYPIRPLKRSYFFKENQPRDYALQNARTIKYQNQFFIPLIDDSVINEHFKKRQVIRRHWNKWFHPYYGIYNILNFFFLGWSIFPEFLDGHVPIAYTKTQFKRVWKAEPELLDDTCKHRFRGLEDVNQWLIRYWRICQGDFSPQRYDSASAFYSFGTGEKHVLEKCLKALKTQAVPVICINDGEQLENFSKERNAIERVFQKLFPEKSMFEK